MLSKATIIEEKDISMVKSLIANRLYENGFRQKEISSLLNITQPMICKYLIQKNKKNEVYSASLNVIDKYKKLNFSFLITEDKIQVGSDYFISTNEHILTNEKSVIIDNILSAVEILKGKNLSLITSNVKMNIAMAVKNPEAIDDIASIPGGLIIVNTHLQNYNSPEFGVSRHLAQLILYVGKFNNEMLSIMNIKYSSDVLKQIRKQMMRYSFLDNSYRLLKRKADFDVLIHKGSFGIEPTCYIFGKSAIESVEKCCKLLR